MDAAHGNVSNAIDQEQHDFEQLAANICARRRVMQQQTTQIEHNAQRNLELAAVTHPAHAARESVPGLTAWLRELQFTNAGFYNYIANLESQSTHTSHAEAHAALQRALDCAQKSVQTLQETCKKMQQANTIIANIVHTMPH